MLLAKFQNNKLTRRFSASATVHTVILWIHNSHVYVELNRSGRRVGRSMILKVERSIWNGVQIPAGDSDRSTQMMLVTGSEQQRCWLRCILKRKTQNISK